MKAAPVAAILWIIAADAAAQTPALLLFGGEDHQTFLGCLNCSKFDNSSICNKLNDVGSVLSANSIWNQFGTFGSKYSNDSPWNEYTTGGPVIVDNAGQFYGRFTANKYIADRTQIAALNQLADIVASGASLDAAQNLFCGQ